MKVKAGGGMNEEKKPDLTAEDVRFTTKDGFLYAFAQGWPRGECLIEALGLGSTQKPGHIASVEMLGVPKPLRFRQEEAVLRITPPDRKPAAAAIGVTFKVRFS